MDRRFGLGMGLALFVHSGRKIPVPLALFPGAASYPVCLAQVFTSPLMQRLTNRLNMPDHDAAAVASVLVILATGTALYLPLERPIARFLPRWHKSQAGQAGEASNSLLKWRADHKKDA